MRRRADATFTPWLVLAAALLFTAAASMFVAWSARERDAARFENAVAGAQDRIQGRLEVYMATLRGAASLFASSDTVHPVEFARFAARLDVQRRYPGIQGIGWSQRIAAEMPGEVDERHAIRLLEPMDVRNRAAIGFDMYAEPTRREAMRRARDLGEPALSGRVTLVQEIFGERQAGFLLYVPVYQTTEIPRTVEERRAALAGFIYAPFRADDFFEGIFGSEGSPRVSFRVYDGRSVDAGRLLHRSPRSGGDHPDHVTVRTFLVAGQPWTVVFASEPAFEAGSRLSLLPAVLLTGLLVSWILFMLVRGQARTRIAAESANRAKSEFLSTMSHELRTPLNAIAGYVDLLEMGIRGELNEKQRRDVLRIKIAQQHLLSLINDILNFAKVDAGHLELRREPVEIRSLVDALGEMMGPQFRAKDLALVLDGEPRPLHAVGDADRIRQIVLNLLSNSAKFTPSGGRVTLRTRQEEEWAVVEVEDTGPGIAAEKLQSIFEPFVQVDRRQLTESQQGVGLGLAISRRLAEAMKGEISVESRLGVGTLFRLRLPGAAANGKGEAPGGRGRGDVQR